MTEIAALPRITHQRVTQMRQEGKLPDPDQIDGVGPLWKLAAIERWAERKRWGTRRWRRRTK